MTGVLGLALRPYQAHYQNNEDLQEIGRRVRDTQQLVIDINELATRSSLPNALNQRYLEACQKFEEWVCSCFPGSITNGNHTGCSEIWSKKLMKLAAPMPRDYLPTFAPRTSKA